MGYYNMPAAKLPPAALTPQQAAAQAVKSMEALEILHKLVYNAAVCPKEDKYRKVRITNPKIQETLVKCEGALDVLLTLGWVEDGEEYMAIPEGKFMTMKDARILDEAKEKLKKDMADEARLKKLKSGLTPSSSSNAINLQA